MDSQTIISPHTASLKSLHIFCSAAKELSFKKAADQLFITPSAVSHQIRGLEKRLNRDLFTRGTRAIELTDDGQQLFERLDPLLNQIYSEINALSKEARILLKVVLPPFLSTEFFIPKLAEFSTTHPQIDIHLDTQMGRPDIHHKSADVSILLCKSKPEQIRSRMLFPLILIPVCSPSYNLDFDKEDPLAGKTLIIHHQRPNAWKNWLSQTDFQSQNSTKILVLESMTAVVKSAEQGLGCAMVPKHLVSKWINSETLVQAHPHKLNTEDKYYLSWDSRNKNAREIQIFIDWVMTIF